MYREQTGKGNAAGKPLKEPQRKSMRAQPETTVRMVRDEKQTSARHSNGEN